MVDTFIARLAEDATLWSIGEVTTAELVRVACDKRVEALVSLDDQYDILEYTERSSADVDAAVLAAAARLTDTYDLS